MMRVESLSKNPLKGTPKVSQPCSELGHRYQKLGGKRSGGM
jgi:hypothetical protein